MIFGKKKKKKEPEKKDKKVQVEFGSLEDISEDMKSHLADAFKQLFQELSNKELKTPTEENNEIKEILKQDGMYIELEAIPTFIEFIYKNMTAVGKLSGQDKDGKHAKGLKSFLEHQNELFKESLKGGR